MNDWKSRLSLRRLLAALVGGLAVLTASQAVEALIGHWAEYRAAERAELAAEAVVELMRGAQDLAFERGRTNVVLRGERAITPENRLFLDGRRGSGDHFMAQAEHRLMSLNEVAAEKLRRDRQRLAMLRRTADDQAELPLAQRDPNFADEWFRSLSQMLDSVPDFVFALGGDDGLHLPPYGRAALLAFELRNALGIESSRLASILAARTPPTNAVLAEMSRLRGQAWSAWTSLRRETDADGNPVLIEAAAKVEHLVFERFRSLQDGILRDVADDKIPSTDVKTYTAASVPALDAVADLMANAGQQALVRTRAELESQRYSIMWHSLGVVLAAFLGGAAWVLIFYGVLRPARLLHEGLTALVDDRLDAAFPSGAMGREMNRMAAAMELLRRKLQERKQVQAEMDELSRRHRLIVDNADDGIIGLDGVGNTVFANPAALTMTGWSLTEILGSRHHELIHHSHADGSVNPASLCPAALTLADGAPRRADEDVFWRRDGTPFPVEFSVNAWSEGGDKGAVLVFRDISERLKAQQELAELMDELKRSNADLEQFAYAVSHDLKAPVRSISGYAKMLERTLPQPLSEEVREYLGFLGSGAQRMNDMIVGLLGYARTGAGDFAVRAMDAGQAAADAVAELKPEIQRLGAEIQIDGNLPAIMGDPLLLGGILRNLIGNALKYGGGAASPPRIRIGGALRGRRAVIWVDDSGPGIPLELRERAFGLFQRLGRSGGDGIGMGLAICRRAAKRMGGDVEIADAPGGGCRIITILPAP